MRALKIYVCVFLSLFGSGSSVSSSQNETAAFLWKLYNIALQSRQTHNHHSYSDKYSGKYPEYYPGNTYNRYPGSSDPFSYKKYQYPHYKPIYTNYKPTFDDTNPSSIQSGSTYPSTHHHHPYPYRLPSKGDYLYKPHHHYGYPNPPTFANTKESIMEVLNSIAQNDDLHCVPKLICEVTSGTISGRQQGLNLPINLNVESILGFLSVLNGAQSSPLIYFGKAALLGFSSKGNTRTCNYAYPECPQDPDKVVNYLNNHNGGFFRFFKESKRSHNSFRKKSLGEERIQNNVLDYSSVDSGYQNSVTFPKDEDEVVQEDSFRSEKGLKFPNHEGLFSNELNKDSDHFSFQILKFPDKEYGEGYKIPQQSNQNLNALSLQTLKFPNRESNRRPKEVFDYLDDYEKPLPNHKATPMIFPVRTGTGDLRLDPEELEDYRRPIYYEDDDVRVIFNEGNREDRSQKGFAFPQR